MARTRDLDGFAGAVLAPGDPGYDAARRVYNGRFEAARPELILRPRGPADVASAIAHAGATGMPLVVRAGGHSAAGLSAGHGAVVLDVRGLAEIDIDPRADSVWVGGGVLARDVVSEAFRVERTVPFGDTATVGVAGITLGGGLGWLSRRDGLTVDSLLAAELVTADGRLLTASADEHADLFWAIRGGGGNFGVITRLHFRLRPVDQVLFGNLTFLADRDTLAQLVPMLLAAPDALTAMPNVMFGPPADDAVPGAKGPLMLYLALCWSGSLEAGQRALAPLRALGQVLDDTVAPMPYPAVYGDELAGGITEEAASVDHGNWGYRSLFLDDLGSGPADAIERGLTATTSPVALAHMRVLGGAIARTANDATACGWRDRAVMVTLIADDADRTDPGATESWLDDLETALRRYGGGAYPNFMGTASDRDVRAAYPAASFERLGAIKRRYDPTDLFRATYHIPPA